MIISSLQENFKNSLNIVSHIAGKNANLPILNNVLIEAKNGDIRLITTDLELGIVSRLRGKVEQEGAFTIEAKILNDYVSLLPNQKIDLKVVKNEAQVNCENYKTAIKGQLADDFPLVPEVERSIFYKAELGEFKKALSQVIFAVSTSETRAELSGVYFEFNKNSLIMAATDSYRLAEKTVKIETNSDEGKSVIIPAKALQEVIRIISAVKQESMQEESKITFYLSENQVLFIMGNTELISRLLEGQYPDYRQIIPNRHATSASVAKPEFLRAVKAAALFSKSGINDVNLDFPEGKNKVVISSASSQTGENITELDAAVSGQDNGIVVNYRYLLDGANNIDSEKITIKVIDGNTPCILKGVEEDNYTYIIMPIKQ